MWILYTVIAMIAYGIGEYTSKKYTDTGNTKFILLSFIFFNIMTSMWLPALQQKSHLIMLSTSWLVFELIVALMVGLFILGEKLNPYNIGGLILAIVAIYLLSK